MNKVGSTYNKIKTAVNDGLPFSVVFSTGCGQFVHKPGTSVISFVLRVLSPLANKPRRFQAVWETNDPRSKIPPSIAAGCDYWKRRNNPIVLSLDEQRFRCFIGLSRLLV